MKLRRDGGPLLRIGHRGAAALAPANTLEAIEAGFDAGVDAVELDVLSVPGGGVALSHSARELPSEPATLSDALQLVARRGGCVQLDMKSRGLERAVVDELRRYDLVERAFASTTDLAILRELARLEPRLQRSVTYPRNRGRARALERFRWAVPGILARRLAAVDAAAATLQHRVVTASVVERCHDFGAAVLVWTVNDRTLVERFEALGVDGVITDDPGVFRATLSS